MPSRSDERWANRSDDLHYCVFCKQYIGAKDWAIHPHNYERSLGGQFGFFKGLLRRVKR